MTFNADNFVHYATAVDSSAVSNVINILLLRDSLRSSQNINTSPNSMYEDDARKKLDADMVVVKVKCEGKILPGVAVMTTEELSLSKAFASKMLKTKNGNVIKYPNRSVCTVLAVKKGGIMKLGDRKSGMAFSFPINDTDKWYHYDFTVQDEIDQKQRSWRPNVGDAISVRSLIPFKPEPLGYRPKYKCKVVAEQPMELKEEGDGIFTILVLEGEDSIGETYGFAPWTEVWCFDDKTKTGRVEVGDVLWVCWREEDEDDYDEEKTGGKKSARKPSGGTGAKAQEFIDAGWTVERKKTGDLRVCMVAAPSGETFRTLRDASLSERAKLYGLHMNSRSQGSQVLVDAGWDVERGADGKIRVITSPTGQNFTTFPEAHREFKNEMAKAAGSPVDGDLIFVKWEGHKTEFLCSVSGSPGALKITSADDSFDYAYDFNYKLDTWKFSTASAAWNSAKHGKAKEVKKKKKVKVKEKAVRPPVDGDFIFLKYDGDDTEYPCSVSGSSGALEITSADGSFEDAYDFNYKLDMWKFSAAGAKWNKGGKSKGGTKRGKAKDVRSKKKGKKAAKRKAVAAKEEPKGKYSQSSGGRSVKRKV